MKSQGYMLNYELDNGLKKYGEDNNLSPISIIEDLVEDFLCSKGYLCTDLEFVPVKIEQIKYAAYRKNSKTYQIQKQVAGIKRVYGSSKSPVVIKELIQFLESVNWDLKYSTQKTKLRGVNQINFLLKEMEQNR